MSFQIINQQKNPFLKREEYLIKIESETSPSFEDIQKQMNKDAELTIIKKVQGKFGTKIFNAEVFVYDSKEAKEKIEVIPKKIKKKLEEEAKKKAEEAKQEDIKEETKSEEVKE